MQITHSGSFMTVCEQRHTFIGALPQLFVSLCLLNDVQNRGRQLHKTYIQDCYCLLAMHVSILPDSLMMMMKDSSGTQGQQISCGQWSVGVFHSRIRMRGSILGCRREGKLWGSQPRLPCLNLRLTGWSQPPYELSAFLSSCIGRCSGTAVGANAHVKSLTVTWPCPKFSWLDRLWTACSLQNGDFRSHDTLHRVRRKISKAFLISDRTFMLLRMSLRLRCISSFQSEVRPADCLYWNCRTIKCATSMSPRRKVATFKKLQIFIFEIDMHAILLSVILSLLQLQCDSEREMLVNSVGSRDFL